MRSQTETNRSMFDWLTDWNNQYTTECVDAVQSVEVAFLLMPIIAVLSTT